MANLIHHPEWNLPERLVTSETAFENRRDFLRKLGLSGAGLLATMFAGCGKSESRLVSAADSPLLQRPAQRNPAFNPGWPLTNETSANTHNNFYEFSLGKNVSRHVGKFVASPWTVQITGLVEKPMTLDVQELTEMFDLEERVYRFRCVEAWAMIVPWTGFQLSQLIEKVMPKPEAKFVRFESFNRPDQAPGIANSPEYPWPYHEGLRLDEAMNALTMLATGIYGKPLSKQHGAPLRLVVPWKYGYKSAKSIVKIEFVNSQPATFWETLVPNEYPFESNVNPRKPHPRWSQASERMIDTGEDCLPRGILGLNAGLFREYVQHIADRRLERIGLDAKFHSKNPFPWMSETIDLGKEKNFFETRVTEYQTGGSLAW